MIGGASEFVAVKGVGWTWATPRVYRSTKDPELTFGLLAKVDAARELRVSRWLSNVEVAAGEVLGLGRLSSVPTVGGTSDVSAARWSGGAPIEPCLLYTRHRSPYRVADLAFLTEQERSLATAAAADVRGWRPAEYVEAFASDLGRSMAVLHLAGCINDTRSSDNTTLAGEVTDFEWFTVPGIPLPDGSTVERLAERQEKELVYAVEIVTHLAHYLGRGAAARDAAASVLETYSAHSGPQRNAAARLLVDDVAGDRFVAAGLDDQLADDHRQRALDGDAQ